MTRVFMVLLMCALCGLGLGCAGQSPSVTSRFDAKLEVPAPEALVWVGRGESSRFEGGQWKRTPEQDYSFMVYQRRFADRWESQKVQNRADVGYGGEAGEADQQHMFVLEYGAVDGQGRRPYKLRSTYGEGQGSSDVGYRDATMEIKADISSFAPYNHIRITQRYEYEAGQLVETVELFKRDEEGEETPFVRVQERATMYRAIKGAAPSM